MTKRTSWGRVGIVASLWLAACGGSSAPVASSASSTESSGAEASPALGSCYLPSMLTCEAYEGPVEASQLATRRESCAATGGTWAEGPCPSTDALASCTMPAPSETGGVPGTAMRIWFYAGSSMFCQGADAGPLPAQCQQQGGTWFEVARAPMPVCSHS